MLRTYIWISICFVLIGVVHADDRDVEVAGLRERVAILEAENQNLRTRLAEIAIISTELNAQPSSSLVIMLTSDDWGDARKADILKVLYSSATPIWDAAGKPSLHPISVFNDPNGPLVAYARGPSNAYKVLLNVRGRLWARMTYQFSHEICHVLANYRDVPNKQKWFEEAVCECASLYTLRAMGRSWKTSPPYANWKSYADELTNYADNRMREAASVPDGNLAAWYAIHKQTLESSSPNRELSLVVAVKLLAIFEMHSNTWGIVRSLNLGDAHENESLPTYLAGWHSRLASSDKHFVEEIADLFAIPIAQNSPQSGSPDHR